MEIEIIEARQVGYESKDVSDYDSKIKITYCVIARRGATKRFHITLRGTSCDGEGFYTEGAVTSKCSCEDSTKLAKWLMEEKEVLNAFTEPFVVGLFKE